MAENEWVKRFRAELKRPDGIGTWTYVDVPFDAQASFGGRGQIHVRGTVNGAAFRSSLMPRGDGTHYLVVGAELRTEAGAVLGDSIDVEVRLDLEERVVEVPDDVREAIRSNPEAEAFWNGLAYSYRKEYVKWIGAAKREETRRSRTSKAVALLAEGKKLK